VTPRLHAVHMFNYVHYFTGYRDESMQKLYALVREAVNPKHGGGPYGNAAMDYIGYGGDKFSWQVAPVCYLVFDGYSLYLQYVPEESDTPVHHAPVA